MSPNALYLYGVVRASADLSLRSEGVAGSPVRTLIEGSVAGIVGDVPDVSFQARRSDLMSHSNVLQEAVEATDVLPLRFGTVFSSPDELRGSLLRPNHDELVRMLDRLRGAVEVQVKGDYDEAVVAREIVASDRAVQKLQQRARSRGDVESKIELGRRFASALDQRRYVDAHNIVERLAPLSRAVEVGHPTGEYGMVNASFLVSRDQLPRFDAAVEEVQRTNAPVIKLRYLAPLPPYSFVDAEAVVVA